MAKYIKCDCCGKRIEFGNDVYQFAGYAGLYCSGECFAQAYGEVKELDQELTEDCYHKVYDDGNAEILRSEINKTLAEIASLQAHLIYLQSDLKAYESA